MGYQATHPGYSVRVDGIALGRTRFAIQASVDYESELSAPERERFAPKAQLELLLAILGEWERAVRIGARTVRIAVLGDGHLDRFFRMRVSGLLPASARGVRPSGATRPQPLT